MKVETLYSLLTPGGEMVHPSKSFRSHHILAKCGVLYIYAVAAKSSSHGCTLRARLFGGSRARPRILKHLLSASEIQYLTKLT